MDRKLLRIEKFLFKVVLISDELFISHTDRKRTDRMNYCLARRSLMKRKPVEVVNK